MTKHDKSLSYKSPNIQQALNILNPNKVNSTKVSEEGEVRSHVQAIILDHLHFPPENNPQ